MFACCCYPLERIIPVVQVPAILNCALCRDLISNAISYHLKLPENPVLDDVPTEHLTHRNYLCTGTTYALSTMFESKVLRKRTTVTGNWVLWTYLTTYLMFKDFSLSKMRCLSSKWRLLPSTRRQETAGFNDSNLKETSVLIEPWSVQLILMMN